MPDVPRATPMDCQFAQEDYGVNLTINIRIRTIRGLRTSALDFWLTTFASMPSVVLWWSGNPRRELLHVDDLADACIFLNKLNKKDYSRFFNESYTLLINIGCGKDQTIKEIAAIVAEVVGYNGDVRWDQDKPDGTLQKLLDISQIKRLGWKPKIALKDGIRNVYEWYLKGIK